MSLTNRIMSLLRQERRHLFVGEESISAKTIFTALVLCYLSLIGYEVPTEETTIEYVERMYEKGYEAIINDGKLLGFKKAL